MKQFRSLLAIILGILLSQDSISDEKLKELSVIYAGNLLSEPGQEVLNRQSIIIENGIIKKIQSGFIDIAALKKEGVAVELIDLSNHFVLPGLMDMHVHLLSGGKGKGKRSKASKADYAINGVENARVTLEAGFTTVRDVGASADVIFPIKHAIDQKRIAGPRVIASGSAVSATGGHGDRTGYNEKELQHSQQHHICDGPFDCRRAVRAQVKRGADLIKITASGGGGKPQGGPDADPEFYDDELRAIVLTAHRLDKKVAAHAHSGKAINTALKAGVDSIEHGTFLDKDSIQWFKRSGAFLVPTLSVRDNLIRDIDTMSSMIKKRAKLILDITPKVMGDAYRAGVKFALGTDAGVVPHGDNAREFDWLIKIGMTPEDAIKTATIHAAELIGMSDKLGTLSKGKYADIIATYKNPLDDITALKEVVFVMREGVVYKQE